jgi:DNA-binding NtrC family response regulator
MVCIINKFIMKNKNWIIAFVEDEILISLALRAQLKKKYGDTLTYKVYKDFVIAEKSIDELSNTNQKIVLISDYNIGGKLADDFFAIINTKYPNIIKILISAHENPVILQSNLNIFKFIKKPWTEKEIIDTLEKAFQ